MKLSIGKVFTICLAICILCLVAFAALTGDILRAALPSFDARIGGYGQGEALAYLQWLESEGLSDVYLSRFSQIDMIFPAALGGLLASAVFGLWARPARTVAQLGALVCLFYVGFDYMENMAVRALLEAGHDGATGELIAQASFFTELKWTALFASCLLIVVGLALTAVMRGKR